MNHQAILDTRMAEVRQRADAKKAAAASLIGAHPDIKAWLDDWRQHGVKVSVESFRFAWHGPLKQDRSYVAVTLPKEINGKKGRKG